jgi:Mrp family chromosome partitioning ATPase
MGASPVARADGDGASAPSSSFAGLERKLDRTIDCLVKGPQTREARALLIEARRLRSVVANWRSIPPPPAVLEEMLEHVRQLSTSVGAAFPESIAHMAAVMDPIVPAVAVHYEEEETEAYALDFEPHLYSLETATNRRAVPAPPADEPLPEYGEPLPEYGEPLAEGGGGGPVPSIEPHSEEEPTRAWSNASVRPPADFDDPAPATAPAPWPVDEPQDRISSIITNGRASAVPPAPRLPGLPLPVAVAPAPRPATTSSPDLSLHAPPDREPAAPAPRVVTYDFDTDGPVPRTQIVAHAAKLSDPPNPLLVVLSDPYSPRADAYRTLRRKLASNAATARTLAVTSANPGEGKTVFAVNLALTLRESVRSRVLVIEANLRAPIMGKLLGFETPACFLSQLQAQAQRHAEDPPAPWVVAEPLPKLHVMAIDPRLPREPLLDPAAFSMGMERLKQAGYEYIIVDSPPVLGSLDCNVISDAVDAMILTALPMKSLRREMRKAVEQLEPALILGVVVLEA